jgi:hypothetical protein
VFVKAHIVHRRFGLFHTTFWLLSVVAGNFFLFELLGAAMVERNKSSGGLNCDPVGGGGGNGIGSRASGFGLRGAHFNSHKSDNFACRLQSTEAFDEGRLFSAMKLDVERTLRDTGAQITQNRSSGPANFYFAYELKNASGQVELSGTRTGGGYYDVRADLNETGN